MIEKMKFISITGPKSDIDRIVSIYLNKYEIHLENALSELSNVQDLRPFVEVNPYKDVLNKASEMVKKLDTSVVDNVPTTTVDEAAKTIDELYSTLEENKSIKSELKLERNHLKELLTQIEPFRMLNYDLRKILHFKFIKYRFGRISHDYFNKFSKYIYDNLDIVFYESYHDKDYVWGVYFVPASNVVQVDAIFSSLHFERIMIPDEYEGTPEEAYQAIKLQLSDIDSKIKSIDQKITEFISSKSFAILSAFKTLNLHNSNFDIRKMAALTQEKNRNQVFYILCGWMSQEDTKNFLEETKDDSDIYIITDMNQDESSTTKPPTKLKNPRLFQPFEMFIKMYGLPAYNEIDPTILVALTYSFIFGAMFGDVGQGLCLVVGGYLIYKYKKIAIAAVISVAGIFSTLFGFMYGSLFGFEEILPTFWLKPMHNVMTVLIVAVGLGVILIIGSIILNIINAIKAKDLDKLLFDSNGIAGLIFYLSAVSCVIAMFTGKAFLGGTLLTILLGLPVLAIFLKEPLTHIIEKKSKILPNNKVMFFIESLVELFDVLLTYATNTISFLRVGAFALSHAGMMGVVLMLAGAETGNTNWIIIILGNIIVAAMEGLIVGIQVLRLEYYEMFGRFYRGTGKEFKAFNAVNKK